MAQAIVGLTSKLLRARFEVNAREHLSAYVLGSLANGLLLFELSQLSSRASLQVDFIQFLLVPQLLMIVLIAVVAFAGTLRTGWRWLYAISSTLFGGYAGWRLAFTFTATLELVRPLESKGVPVSEYQGSFYVLALAAAFSYLLTILFLRRSYGKLISTRTVRLFSEPDA